MANEIKTMLNTIKGVKKDWKQDWKETSKSDWKFDFDAVPGNQASMAVANTVLPAITGTAESGSVLTVSNGTWVGTPAPTYTYQWKRAGANISGATSSTYTLVDADATKAVTCVVTATNAINSVSATAVAVTVADLPEEP